MKTLFSVFLVHFQPHLKKKSFFLWAERASSLLIGSSLENRAAITEQLESNLRPTPTFDLLLLSDWTENSCL